MTIAVTFNVTSTLFSIQHSVRPLDFDLIANFLEIFYLLLYIHICVHLRSIQSTSYLEMLFWIAMPHPQKSSRSFQRNNSQTGLNLYVFLFHPMLSNHFEWFWHALKIDLFCKFIYIILWQHGMECHFSDHIVNVSLLKLQSFFFFIHFFVNKIRIYQKAHSFYAIKQGFLCKSLHCQPVVINFMRYEMLRNSAKCRALI